VAWSEWYAGCGGTEGRKEGGKEGGMEGSIRRERMGALPLSSHPPSLPPTFPPSPGGSMHALQQHILAVRAHPLLALPPSHDGGAREGGREGGKAEIDMKLALNEGGARNEQCRRETGFDRLRVTRCQEVRDEGGREGGRERGRCGREPGRAYFLGERD